MSYYIPSLPVPVGTALGTNQFLVNFRGKHQNHRKLSPAGSDRASVRKSAFLRSLWTRCSAPWNQSTNSSKGMQWWFFGCAICCQIPLYYSYIKERVRQHPFCTAFGLGFSAKFLNDLKIVVVGRAGCYIAGASFYTTAPKSSAGGQKHGVSRL